VVAMDPEPDMLAEGRAQAERASVSNIEWRRGGSEDLSAEVGSFRLVTMGNSFHWMDRDRTLDALYDLVSNGGGVAVVGEGAPIPAPPPTPWRVAIDEVVRKYVGNPRLPYKVEYGPEDLAPTFLKRSRFIDLTSYSESFEVTWTIDSMIGNLYSMSFCSRRILGDRVAAFERDLRAAILAVEPSGILRGEPPEFFAYLAWKR
jgi:ubiquinone/menaquinone biosynthesis C-methylase UbiE